MLDAMKNARDALLEYYKDDAPVVSLLQFAILEAEQIELAKKPKYGDLKDCPFCGNSWGAPLVEQSPGGGRWGVGCMNPRCGGSSGFSDTKEEAIAGWNMRANA